MLDTLIRYYKQQVKDLKTRIKVLDEKELPLSKSISKIIADALDVAKHELKCLEYLKLFITNAQVIKTDKEQIVSVVSTIKDQKVLVDLIRFIIKEAV